MSFFKFSILISLSMSSVAGANAKVVGNAGKVIVCSDSHKAENYQLVDFYEAKLLRGWEPQLPTGSQDPVVLAAMTIAKLQSLNPTRYARYQKFLESFMKETKFVSGQELVDIPDSNHPTYPENCRVAQLAIQRQPLTSNDPRYIINQDLWSKMNVLNQAGLILHEVIYREQILADITTSEQTRFINSAFWSRQMEGFDQAQYFEFIKDFVPDIDFDGYNFAICRPGSVGGEIQQCAQRVLPTVENDNGQRAVHGFILPPWAPLAMGQTQYFRLVDPVDKSETPFIVYGPYVKRGNGLNFSIGADFSPRLKYAGHDISLLSNILPNDEDPNSWQERRKLCYERWECQPYNLDEDKLNLKEGLPYRQWAYLSANLQHHLHNFYAMRMVTAPKSPVAFCEGRVNLFDNGSIHNCNGTGEYRTPDVELAFNNNFVGWSENGQIDYASNLKNSKIKFQKKWIPVTYVSWDRDRGQFIERFSFAGESTFKLDGQNVTAKEGIVNLNKDGDILSISSKGMRMKIGAQDFYLYGWSKMGFGYNDGPLPDGQRAIRLAKPQTLKDVSGQSHMYQPGGWLITVSSSGRVARCTLIAGENCF